MNSLSEQTLIILVLYNCTIEQSEAYKTLILANHNKKLNLLIYNNSPQNKIDNKNQNLDFIEVVEDESNAGVSKAYNTGAQKAKELHLKWILLVDQDTTFPNSFFEITFESIKKFPNEKLFAPILISNNQYVSPCTFKFNRGKISQTVTTGLNSFKNKSLLNSGLLIDTQMYHEVGGYNEKIKLDFSDFYFINKFQEKQANFILTEVKCVHDLSSSEIDLKKQLLRFNYYCSGAFEYGKSMNQLFKILILTIIRTLIMTYRYKTLKYFNVYVTNLFNKTI